MAMQTFKDKNESFFTRVIRCQFSCESLELAIRGGLLKLSFLWLSVTLGLLIRERAILLASGLRAGVRGLVRWRIHRFSVDIQDFSHFVLLLSCLACFMIGYNVFLFSSCSFTHTRSFRAATFEWISCLYSR